MLDTADLSRNATLARFDSNSGVDPDDLALVPSPLHEILSTISSPAFSEFTLTLECYPIEFIFIGLLFNKAARGGEWDG